MRLVVTNDDGIDAPGIACLASVARQLGHVTIVAPDEPQSYMGHRVTTHDPIRVREIGPETYRVSGTPADCTRIALAALNSKVDWVLSGVNRGANLGADTYISGTVAAAREAALLGYRSVALSQYVAKGREVDWDATARRSAQVLDLLFREPYREGWFWNVNLPHPLDSHEECEVVFCPMDFQPLDVKFRQEGEFFHYAGFYHDRGRREGSDVDLCFRGKITITAIPLDVCS